MNTCMQIMNRFVITISASLEADGITVWVDVTGLKAGVDFLSKIGEAIIDSKVRHIYFVWIRFIASFM